MASFYLMHNFASRRMKGGEGVSEVRRVLGAAPNTAVTSAAAL